MSTKLLVPLPSDIIANA